MHRCPKGDIELSCVNAPEEHGRGVSKLDPHCCGMKISLLLELGRDLSNPLRFEGILPG
jgi:hypothetical protein